MVDDILINHSYNNHPLYHRSRHHKTNYTIMKSSTAPSSQKDKKRKTTSLPSSTVDYLKAWMMSPEHVAHPYPTEKEKAQIMADTGIELKQLTNWFVNNRKRYWKPRVEARLKQQVQAQNAAAAAAIATRQRNGDANRGELGFEEFLFLYQAAMNEHQLMSSFP